MTADPPDGTVRFDPGSFRDPAGRVFEYRGSVFRTLDASGLEDWNYLSRTRFFRRSTAARRLIRTRRAGSSLFERILPPGTAAVLQHERVPAVSYPYEWSFGMLRDAALLQLDLVLSALAEDGALKDASPFNIQWFGVSPVFIDTGSFTRRRPGDPWLGYRQFCSAFLYPLFLQAYRAVDFQAFIHGRPDGLSPGEFSSLLSFRDWFRPGVFAHAVCNARFGRSVRVPPGGVRAELAAAGFGPELVRRNAARLHRLVQSLAWNPAFSDWSRYTPDLSYTACAQKAKEDFVRRAAAAGRPSLVWDLGAGTGLFSAAAAPHAGTVLALDADTLVVERLYRDLRASGPGNILPLVYDAAAPLPGIGWRGRERPALEVRCKPDLILCLALVHHVVFTRGVPLAEFVAWLAALGGEVVLEFVAPDDPMIGRMLVERRGGVHTYSDALLQEVAARFFRTAARLPLPGGTRILYHFVPGSRSAS